MDKLTMKAIKENGQIILELIMGYKLIRCKKWYCTVAGISFIIAAGDAMDKATKTLNKLENRMYKAREDDKSEIDEFVNRKVQMGFCVEK